MNNQTDSGMGSAAKGHSVPRLISEKREGILEPAILVLADGEEFEGEAFGARATAATGELVFNTSLSGYQEIITDPSYAGQVVAFTYPHIGNYGTNSGDDESNRPYLSGIITRDVARRKWGGRRCVPCTIVDCDYLISLKSVVTPFLILPGS